jgi:hypothetical protein
MKKKWNKNFPKACLKKENLNFFKFIEFISNKMLPHNWNQKVDDFRLFEGLLIAHGLSLQFSNLSNISNIEVKVVERKSHLIVVHVWSEKTVFDDIECNRDLFLIFIYVFIFDVLMVTNALKANHSPKHIKWEKYHALWE